MKPNIRFLSVLLLITFFSKSQAQKTYNLIPKETGKVNKTLAASLPTSLKALAAFYSAVGGTGCIELDCSLTTALGLGKQGSDTQKKLIQKYFPDDQVAKLVVSQDCYLPPSGSSSFSNFQTLAFIVTGDTVRVNYQLAVFDHGNTKIICGPDIYLYENQVYKNKKRVLYAWAGK